MQKDEGAEFKNIKSLATIGENILVNLIEVSGNKYVDIRKYYTEKESNELKPTKKGIMISVESWEEFVDTINEIEI